jgi:phospholipid transport system substrate-binding protein
VLASLIALAVAANPGPLAVVKSADAEVEKILQSPEPTPDKLAERAEQFVDFAELAKRAFGKDWATLKKPQQDEFSLTMKGLLRASYAQKAISDGRGGAKSEYGEEKIDGNEAVVETTLVVKQERIPIIYKLSRPNPNGAWKVYDVVTDDVSLVATYNDEFRKVMGKKGFDGLLSSLKARKEQMEKNNAEKKKGDVAKAGNGGASGN